MSSPAVEFVQLVKECEPEGLSEHNGKRLAGEIARIFEVKSDEVAILKIERGALHFVYPHQLRAVGNIPLSTASSVAVRTANTQCAETINNFAQVKHASIFESPNVGVHITEARKRDEYVIQKLISAPVVSGTDVLGVIQVSRKGASPESAGPDFTPMDLQRLVGIAVSMPGCFK